MLEPPLSGHLVSGSRHGGRGARHSGAAGLGAKAAGAGQPLPLPRLRAGGSSGGASRAAAYHLHLLGG